VLCAHGLAAYALHSAQPESSFDAAEQALEIDLTPLPMTLPDAVASDATPQEAVDDAVEPVEDITKAAEEVVEPAKTAETETVEPVQKPVETAALQPDTVEPVEDVQPETEAAPEEPQAIEPLVDEVEVPDVVTPEVVAMLPQPRPVIEDKPKEKPAPKKPTQVEKKQDKPDRKEPVAKEAEAKPAPAPAAQNSRSSKASKAPSVSPARWQSRVLAWINRHKRYPRGAKSRREEGMVQVSFAINASGSVVSARIASSSGNPELDKAALEMLHRASPVPAPPPEIASNRMSLSVPVQFNLR
jgi:protein TonB